MIVEERRRRWGRNRIITCLFGSKHALLFFIISVQIRKMFYQEMLVSDALWLNISICLLYLRFLVSLRTNDFIEPSHSRWRKSEWNNTDASTRPACYLSAVQLFTGWRIKNILQSRLIIIIMIPVTNDDVLTVKAKAVWRSLKPFNFHAAALIVWRKFKMCTLLKRFTDKHFKMC